LSDFKGKPFSSMVGVDFGFIAINVFWLQGNLHAFASVSCLFVISLIADFHLLY
jgi:hypothetical protein